MVHITRIILQPNVFFLTSSGIQHFVIFAAQPYGLPLKEVTIAQYLKNLGYKTHAVGKVSSLRSMQYLQSCRRGH